MPAKVCVITPALPPAIDGLGDYCKQLWSNWPREEQQDEVIWHFLVVSEAAESCKHWPEVSIDQFNPDATGLLSALERINADIVLLQYVGYGYESSGRPYWLCEALEAWCASGPNKRLIVMFHETWASGFPWQKVFWQQSGQRRCAARLLSMASPAVTSNQATLRDLESLALSSELITIPLGSSFSLESGLDRLWSQLLIFGKESSRLRAITLHGNLVRSMTAAGLIDSIVLAGQCSSQAGDCGKRLIESWNLAVEVRAEFNFERDKVPSGVTSSGLSLMHTQSTCLLKSTSFQLAAKLGQVPIVIQEEDPGDSVFPGRHYLGYKPGHVDSVLDVLRNPAGLESISANISELGATRLSWTEIAKSWSALLACGR